MTDVIILDRETPCVCSLCNCDKRLAKLIEMVGEITYSPNTDGYAFLIHEIIEQMLSIKAGKKIYERLVAICNGAVTVKAVSSLTDEELKATGTSTAKVAYIRNITKYITDGRLRLEEMYDLPDSEVIKKLTEIKGIGTWTAKMYLIFVLDRQDVLPFEDGAFLQVYRWLYKTDDVSKLSIMKKCKKWKPYSSIAARFMYRALDMGLTKEEFHLYK